MQTCDILHLIYFRENNQENRLWPYMDEGQLILGNVNKLSNQ